MTVCTFYAQLARFWEITKVTSFWGNSWRFPAGKKLPALVENHFHSEAMGFVCTVFSSSSSAKFTEETWQFGFDENNTARRMSRNSVDCRQNVFFSLLDIVIKQGIESNLVWDVLNCNIEILQPCQFDARVVFIVSHVTRVLALRTVLSLQFWISMSLNCLQKSVTNTLKNLAEVNGH